MMMLGLGASEMLLLLLMSSAGRPHDLATLLPAADYFKAREIEVSADKLMELAASEPKDGKTQIAQLLALAHLADDDGPLRKSPKFADYRLLLEQIAAGQKARDSQGFAQEAAGRLLAKLDGKAPPRREMPGLREDALAWFPASCNFVTALDSRGGGIQGLGQRLPTAEFLKLMPKDAKQKFYDIIETLGNIRIDRVAFAYAFEPKKPGRMYFRISGKFHPERVGQVLDSLAMMKRQDEKMLSGENVILFKDRDQMLALVGDEELLVVGTDDSSGDHLQLIKQMLVVKAKKQPSAAEGVLKQELAKVPVKASGMIVGTFPDSTRGLFQGIAGAVPRTINASVQATPNGLDIDVALAFDGDDQSKAFVAKASQYRQDGLNALKNLAGAPVPGLNAMGLQNLLESLQINATGGDARLRVLIPGDLLHSLPLLLMGRAG